MPYPTGKNFYGIDPDKVPKPASYEMGIKLADQMLADHVKKNGKYPEKVSFVIWGDETMRHEGVLESQIFHLLGTKPVWDARGKVVDVEVIPRATLGRPRVDIVIASAAEGMFNNVTLLMDRAVQKVKAIEEAENYVRSHYLKTKAILVQRGYTEAEADRRAGVRIFDEPPGTFNLNTSTITAASGTWDTDKGMADDYLRKLGHGYGNGFWGEKMEDVFRLALSGTEKIVHSSSTMLYGALDNDDMFMYMGGLATAIRNIDGTEKSPELVITNTRDPGKPEMTSIDKFIGTEFRSRYMNPTWIEGMKKEGYAGAGEMRSFVDVPVGLGRDRHRHRHQSDVEGVVRRLRRGHPQPRDEGVLRAAVAVPPIRTSRRECSRPCARATGRRTRPRRRRCSRNTSPASIVTASAARSIRAAIRGCSSS